MPTTNHRLNSVDVVNSEFKLLDPNRAEKIIYSVTYIKKSILKYFSIYLHSTVWGVGWGVGWGVVVDRNG